MAKDIEIQKFLILPIHLTNIMINLDIVDPIADQDEALDNMVLRYFKKSQFRKKYSIIILSVAHEKFSRFDINKWKSICSESYAILDLKGIVPKQLKPLRP